jgi:hypothetical protein
MTKCGCGEVHNKPGAYFCSECTKECMICHKKKLPACMIIGLDLCKACAGLVPGNSKNPPPVGCISCGSDKDYPFMEMPTGKKICHACYDGIVYAKVQ